jgi:hypothetical protein
METSSGNIEAVIDDLAQLANSKLKPGGLLLIIAGSLFIPKVSKILIDSGLHYVDTLCFVYSRISTARTGKPLMKLWKPVFLFSKGPPKLDPLKGDWSNVITIQANERTERKATIGNNLTGLVTIGCQRSFSPVPPLLTHCRIWNDGPSRQVNFKVKASCPESGDLHYSGPSFYSSSLDWQDRLNQDEWLQCFHNSRGDSGLKAGNQLKVKPCVF